ncbi:MAG: SURF1 family protein [Gemmatimonadetes bacterium]|nr:SURF1 family protein [Gemmatimonadota bacterium]
MLSRLLAAALALAAALLFVGLGFWQLDRHAERAARNALIEARLAQGPLDLASALGGDSAEYRRARVSGVFDFSRQVVQQGRVVGGVPAVYIATPLIVGPDRAILVERGWVASPDARGVDLARLREPDTAVVEGVLLRLEGGGASSDTAWPRFVRRADPTMLQPWFPYALAPLVLRRTALPPAASEVMGVAPVPARTRGPHLSYAVQWFLFAAIAVIGPLVGSGILRPGGRATTAPPHY